jgi:S1-C subfamily serine protease
MSSVAFISPRRILLLCMLSSFVGGAGFSAMTMEWRQPQGMASTVDVTGDMEVHRRTPPSISERSHRFVGLPITQLRNRLQRKTTSNRPSLAVGVNEDDVQPGIEPELNSSQQPNRGVQNVGGSDDVVSIPEARVFTPEEDVNIRVYESVNRSVVNITTKSLQRGPFLLLESELQGSGSGSVIDQSGHILTNFHVVSGAEYMSVTLFNGKVYEAEAVGVDPQNDIAVIKIKAPAEVLFPIEFGESGDLRVGQKIFAIGNPFGLERTLTTGIISSLNRTLPSRKADTYMKGIIQIDAALNQGNSGGPLIDTQAKVIGMNTAIANPSQTGENTGVGFSIPVNTIRRVTEELIQFGKVIRADLGIALTWSTPEGLGIAKLDPGGPAERAGLRGVRIVRQRFRQGLLEYDVVKRDVEYADRILAIDGQPMASYDDLQTFLNQRKPGDKVIVTVLREGKSIDVDVKLAAEE